jgi:hypothetical protein
MARNRKHQSAAIRFGPALKAFLLCLLIGGSGVGYVWQKDQISQLGRQIKKGEMRLDDLERENDKARRRLGSMRAPQYVERRIQDLRLGLVPTQPAQVWRLVEPAAELPQPGCEQYATPHQPRAEPRG